MNLIRRDNSNTWFSLHVHSSSLRHTILLHIFRYGIYLDEVKPKDLSVNFLQEFMDLPLSYLAPGAAVKFRKYFTMFPSFFSVKICLVLIKLVLIHVST